MSQKLRELIRTVRGCKTAAEERAVIAKECALIRTAFKDEDTLFRHRNIAKLIYISMLGYPTHFGQLETLKLIASQKFSDKRIGYLGMALLIEEHAEFLTLVTNSLSQDMLCQTNPYVCGLALGAMANVGSKEMLRDLTQNLSKILDQTHEPYIKKKALICFALLFKHEPELAPDFLGKISALLSDNTHAIQLTSMTCLYETCRALQPQERGKIRKACLLTVIRILKRLVTGDAFQPEFDVSGHCDPHLQIMCLKFLRVLGEQHEKASEEMSDILAQVATNTDGAKNAGNAILNEVVKTIMGIESEQSLKVLAVNIMGKFLGNKDVNMKYVALAALERLVVIDFAAVARQRTTIVQCLKDQDVSIRNRALEDTFLLLEPNSVEDLMREIVQYLGVAPQDQKSALASRICDTLDRFPQQSRKWQIDTLLDVLTVAGNEAARNVWRHTVSLIGQSNVSAEMRAHIAHRLFSTLEQQSDIQLGLAQCGLWVLGEFGNELLREAPQSCAEAGFVCQARKCGEILDVVQRMLRAHDADTEMKGMALTALTKLSVRLGSALNATDKQRLERLLATYKSSMNVELQLRSVEYTALMQHTPQQKLADILQPMPVPNEEKLKEVRTRKHKHTNAHAGGDEENESASGMPSISIGMPTSAAPVKNLLDLDDLFGGGGGGAAAPAAAAPVAVQQQSNDLLDLFGGGSVAPAAPTQPTRSVVAFNEGPLKIVLTLQQPAIAPGQVAGTFHFTTNNGEPLSNVALLAAVPKYMTIKLHQASSSDLSQFSPTLTQDVEFTNPVDKPYTMKLKVTYNNAQGQPIVAQAVVTEFPK